MVENKRELKVGDKVWAFRNQGPDGKYTIIRSDIIEDIYEGDDEKMYVSFRYIWHDTELDDLGVNFFLTEQEAEEAFKKQ